MLAKKRLLDSPPSQSQHSDALEVMDQIVKNESALVRRRKGNNVQNETSASSLQHLTPKRVATRTSSLGKSSICRLLLAVVYCVLSFGDGGIVDSSVSSGRNDPSPRSSLVPTLITPAHALSSLNPIDWFNNTTSYVGNAFSNTCDYTKSCVSQPLYCLIGIPICCAITIGGVVAWCSCKRKQDQKDAEHHKKKKHEEEQQAKVDDAKDKQHTMVMVACGVGAVVVLMLILGQSSSDIPEEEEEEEEEGYWW